MGDPRLAVAFRYAPDERGLPYVTARGRGAVAERIRAVAAAHGVPVREDPDLTAVLARLEVGDAVPVAAFAAVAEVLAWLYRLNARPTPARAAPGAAP